MAKATSLAMLDRKLTIQHMEELVKTAEEAPGRLGDETIAAMARLYLIMHHSPIVRAAAAHLLRARQNRIDLINFKPVGIRSA